MKTLQSTELDQAAALLKSDELVAFPTETVYGLGARLFSPLALRKIFVAKRRPVDNPLIVHIATLAQLEKIAVEIPHELYVLAEAFWPGPLTIILKRHPSVPEVVSAGLDTIAVRMPKHPVARALIEKLGEPIAAPSANLSGKPSSTDVKHVLADFEGTIAAVIDGGASEHGIESSVLSLVSGSKPVLMRPGTITQEELSRVLKQEVALYDKSRNEKVISPGLKYRHYAPRTPMRCFESLSALAKYLAGSPVQKRMLLAREPIAGAHFFPLMRSSFYASLRQADQQAFEEIIIFCDEVIKSDAALMNRIQHALA